MMKLWLNTELKGILEPFTDKDNLRCLKEAGFNILSYVQWTCFKDIFV